MPDTADKGAKKRCARNAEPTEDELTAGEMALKEGRSLKKFRKVVIVHLFILRCKGKRLQPGEVKMEVEGEFKKINKSELVEQLSREQVWHTLPSTLRSIS